MADQIQIPQRNPQYVAPVAPPTDLIQALYNRPKPGEIAASGLGQGVNALLDQYYKRKELEMRAFEVGGPYLLRREFSPNGTTASTTPQGQMAGTVPPSQSQQSAIQPNSNTGPVTAGMPSPSASTANIGQDTPQLGIPQDSQPSSVILEHAAATGHDPTGHAAQFSSQQQQAQENYGITDPAQAVGMGKSGQTFLAGYKTLGDLALQPGAQELQNQATQKGQFEQSQQPTIAARNKQDLINSQQQNPNWIAGKTAEMQGKYGEQDIKTQQGIKALQDFSDSWDQVGSNLKGPKSGGLTSKAGSLFSGVAPDVTTFNKIRENTATALATALLPENARANPLMVKELADTLPSLQSSPQEKQRVLANFASQLQNNALLNYKNNQAQAQAVGGSIKQTQMPTFKQQGTSEIHNAALDWARANPKDPRAKAVLSKARASLQGNQ